MINVPSRSDHSTIFLNVDLDIDAQSGLDELLEAFGDDVVLLNKTDNFASIELTKEDRSLEQSVLNAVDLVRSLSPKAKALWDTSVSCQLNIGIQAPTGPPRRVLQFQVVPPRSLRRQSSR